MPREEWLIIEPTPPILVWDTMAADNEATFYKYVNGCESDLDWCCTDEGVCESDLDWCCKSAADNNNNRK